LPTDVRSHSAAQEHLYLSEELSHKAMQIIAAKLKNTYACVTCARTCAARTENAGTGVEANTGAGR